MALSMNGCLEGLNAMQTNLNSVKTRLQNEEQDIAEMLAALESLRAEKLSSPEESIPSSILDDLNACMS